MTLADRQSLTRELIAETALRLTDHHGLRGLSMRKLGAELGVEAMSLYHYIENKDDLLDAILDRLYAEMDLPTDIADEAWEASVQAGAHALHDVLLAHQAAFELFSSRPAPSLASLGQLAWGYERFVSAGLSATESLTAYRLVISFVLGHVASELGLLQEVRTGHRVDLETIPDGLFRVFVGQNQDSVGTDLFDEGLDILIAGLRATYDLP